MEVSSFNQGAAQSCISAGIEIFRGVWLRSRSCVSSHLFRSSKHEAPFCFDVRFTDRSFLHVFVSKCVFIPSGSNLSLVEIDWPLVKRSLEDPICFLSCVWCDVFLSSLPPDVMLSLCHPMYSNMVVVWVCSWQTDRSKDRTLFCACDLLPPFIPAAVSDFVRILFRCTRTCGRGCCMCAETRASTRASGLTSCPRCTCVHALTPSHLLHYMCPLQGHRILSDSVCLSNWHLIPMTPCMHCMQRGTLLPSSTIETRHVHIPPSLPLSQSGALCLLVVSGIRLSLRTGVRSFRQADCTISFSSWQCLWSGGFWKHDNNKKMYCWQLSGDLCWLLLSITSFMYASWK